MTKLQRPLTAVSLSILAGLSLGSLTEGVAGTRPNLFHYVQVFFHNHRPETVRVLHEHLAHLGQRIPGLSINLELLFYGMLGVATMFIILAIGSVHLSKHTEAAGSIGATLKEEKLENLAELKSEFLNHVSHELRTPLAVIIGYIECITDGLYGHLGPKHQEILEIVAKQSAQLKEMIDQILIYSRLDSNRQELRIREFPLDKVTHELKETFTVSCSQKNLAFLWDNSNGAVILSTDAERLKEILSHLLQNALKYTDQGSISFRSAVNERNRTVDFEIGDTGVGIPQNHLETIFEPFIQVRGVPTEASRGGIGLGLSIVKKDLEQLKGTVAVQSELGKGSLFIVSIPLNLNRPYKPTEHLLSFASGHIRRNSPVFVSYPAKSHTEPHVFS